MLKREDRNALRKRRHLRVRKRLRGTPDRPRLSVFRSLGHIYVQVVDDTRGVTLAVASTRDPEIRDQARGMRKSEASRLVGRLVAHRARERGVRQVVFDRSGYQYHGRVRALADAAREAGLEF